MGLKRFNLVNRLAQKLFLSLDPPLVESNQCAGLLIVAADFQDRAKIRVSHWLRFR